jgi:hypothetical protein
MMHNQYKIGEQVVYGIDEIVEIVSYKRSEYSDEVLYEVKVPGTEEINTVSWYDLERMDRTTKEAKIALSKICHELCRIGYDECSAMRTIEDIKNIFGWYKKENYDGQCCCLDGIATLLAIRISEIKFEDEGTILYRDDYNKSIQNYYNMICDALNISDDLYQIIKVEKILEEGMKEPGNSYFILRIAEIAIDEVLNNNSSVSNCASILTALGGIKELQNDPYAKDIISKALQCSPIEIRDAAIRTVENWGSSHFLPILKKHFETVPWLEEYKQRIIEEIQEEEEEE